MAKFPEDTIDVIEREWAPVILTRFPRYGELWERFIGIRPGSTTTPLHYSLIYPPNMSSEEIKATSDRLEQLFMVHYSIFCNLAGAHYQVELMIRSSALDSRSYFMHWEAFECCYMHLGNVFYMIDRTWKVVLRMGKKSQSLCQYLEQQNKDGLSEELHRLYNKDKDNNGRISMIRNPIVHFARTSSLVMEAGGYTVYIIPANSPPELWSQGVAEGEPTMRTTARAEEDLAATETLLNGLHELMIDELAEILRDKRIEIEVV